MAHAETLQEPLKWPISHEDRERAVKALIEAYGGIYEASQAQKKTAFDIISCEDPDLDPKLQSGAFYKDGTQELSFGLSQIHLPAHPDISKEQAEDPDFAIDFLMKNITQGNAKIWTCYRLIKAGKYIPDSG